MSHDTASTPAAFDLLVIGGGVNGAGIARDAAGRGLSVMLVEQDDLAAHTSSASSKLVHGGLRYLEHYEFRLVREALLERERLLAAAPHIIWPLTFVLPHDPTMRPAWMLRAGLFLYDHLAPRRRLPASQGLDLTRHPYGAPLRAGVTRGFSYADCWVEDSRLVVLNALDARERGADIRVRTRLEGARRENGRWIAELSDLATGVRDTMIARAIVNAAGPWVADVLGRRLGRNTEKRVRLVKGSHIVVPRLWTGDQAYIVQNTDRRIVFAIPYEGAFTLVGTTDVAFGDDPGREPVISAEETQYLLDVIARWFRVPVATSDIVRSYAGVRPLFDDGSQADSEVTRDYVLDLDAPAGDAPALSVFGGKITTFRRLAEHALEELAPAFPGLKGPWTAGAALPGGDMPGADFDAFLADLAARHPWLPADVARRLARAYGTRADRILGGARAMADLGRDFGRGLSEAELAYLANQEWARTAEDVLWRRSKLGLHLDADARAAVEAWFAAAPVTV